MRCMASFTRARTAGERSALGGDLWANVLDRALQYEMNRRELEDEAARQAPQVKF